MDSERLERALRADATLVATLSDDGAAWGAYYELDGTTILTAGGERLDLGGRGIADAVAGIRDSGSYLDFYAGTLPGADDGEGVARGRKAVRDALDRMGWRILTEAELVASNERVADEVSVLEERPPGEYDGGSWYLSVRIKEDPGVVERAEAALGRGSVGHRLKALHLTGRAGAKEVEALEDLYDASLDPANRTDDGVRIGPPDWMATPTLDGPPAPHGTDALSDPGTSPTHRVYYHDALGFFGRRELAADDDRDADGYPTKGVADYEAIGREVVRSGVAVDPAEVEVAEVRFVPVAGFEATMLEALTDDPAVCPPGTRAGFHPIR